MAHFIGFSSLSHTHVLHKECSDALSVPSRHMLVANIIRNVLIVTTSDVLKDITLNKILLCLSVMTLSIGVFNICLEQDIALEMLIML